MNPPSIKQLAAVSLTLITLGAQAAEPVEHLWFADSQKSVFYAIDTNRHEVVVITEPGPMSSQPPSRTVMRLDKGEQLAVSVAGTGLNAVKATLTVGRDSDAISAHIASHVSRNFLAHLE